MKNNNGSVILTEQTPFSPEMMRALGMRLSDIITEFGVTEPEHRLHVLSAMLYGEAANGGMSMRQLAEFCAHAWKEQSRTAEAALQAQRAAQAHNDKKGK